MNACKFLGNVATEPKLVTLENGNRVISFRLAVRRRFKNENNDADFFDFEAWDTGADTIEKHFKKGDEILVECTAKLDTWKDKETGEDRSKVKFRVDRFHFTNGRKSVRTKQEAEAEANG
jgi:single-strand DNA-binding protein